MGPRACLVCSLLLLLFTGHLETRRTHKRRGGTHLRPECNQENSSAIITRVHDAEIIFSGKVASVLDAIFEEEPGLEIERNLRVRIKRVFKGHIPSSGPIELLLPVYKDTNENSNSDLCAAQARVIPRVHDTAIFLARPVAPASSATALLRGKHRDKLALVSNPLPLTLRNLDIVNAAVKDMTYKPRPPILEEPCEKTFCAYGASCQTDASGEARCRCPEDCPSGGTPVCGSDGRSYINECVLRMAACQRQENLRVHHSGECGVVSETRRSKGNKG